MEISQTSASPPATPEESLKQPFFRRVKSRLHAIYHKYEKYTELAIFGVGFIWDSFTMTRVDNVIDHIILLFYLALIGLLIVLTLRRQYGMVFPNWIQKIEPRFTWIMQFCFGGLFSSFVIFYFKSASWSRTLFFFMLLMGLWIGNEFLQHRLRNPGLLSMLYSFCLFSFLAFFLPVLLADIKAWIFVLAGVLSLLISFLIFSIGMRAETREWRRRMKPIVPWIAATFLTIGLFAEFIPWVARTLKAEGIALIFIVAVGLSLLISLYVFYTAMRAENLSAETSEWKRRMKPIVMGIAAIFLTVNVLYFANLIPPVPLALKTVGIYHQVRRTQSGFEVTYVRPPWYRFWRKWDNPFYLDPGESFYCFTAIFAPRKLHVPVFHVWSRKANGEWKQTDRFELQIAGGREGGYRSFTKKSRIAAGEWRVEVMTERGQILGQLDFTAVESPTPHPPLQTKIIR
jgi:hypothetical protein